MFGRGLRTRSINVSKQNRAELCLRTLFDKLQMLVRNDDWPRKSPTATDVSIVNDNLAKSLWTPAHCWMKWFVGNNCLCLIVLPWMCTAKLNWMDTNHTRTLIDYYMTRTRYELRRTILKWLAHRISFDTLLAILPTVFKSARGYWIWEAKLHGFFVQEIGSSK